MKFKLLRKVSFLVICALMLFPVLILAATASDSLGLVGGKIVDFLNKAETPNPIATWSIIAGILGWAFNRFGVPFLSSIKTTWYWNPVTQKFAVGFVTKQLTRIFGKSFTYYNAEFDSSQVGECVAKQAKVAVIKEHFLKHDPILSIEVK